MQIENATVASHRVYQGEYRLLTLTAPRCAAEVKPGQFIHLRIEHLHDAVLRRPFSVFDAGGKSLSILYKRVGRGTAAMQTLRARQPLSLLGPLGNGFPLDLAPKAMPVLVAGGYGAAPLHLLARRLPRPGVVFIGGATAADVLCVKAFEALGWTVQITTNDGSLGQPGLVTAALDAWLAARPSAGVPAFYACGPNGMLQAVGDRAMAGGWKAWLSLDRHMACGVGACLACVQRVRGHGAATWKRVCVDGPIFEAHEIVWDDNLDVDAKA